MLDHCINLFRRLKLLLYRVMLIAIVHSFNDNAGIWNHKKHTTIKTYKIQQSLNDIQQTKKKGRKKWTRRTTSIPTLEELNDNLFA